MRTMGVTVLLLGALALGPMVLAQPDQPAYPELKTAGAFSRVIQGVTGLTPFSGWVANRILHRELSRHVQGKLKNRLQLYSATDLLGGKAKSLQITGKNVLLEQYIPLSEFSFISQPDTPIYVSRTKRPILLRPVTFQVSMTMNEQDINRMLASDKGRALMTDMQVNLPPFGLRSFDAINPSVRLENDGRILINALMNLHDAPQANALPMQLSGKLVPEKASLTLSELDLKIEGVQNTEDMAQVVEHYFNELVDLSHIKVERHKVKVQIQQANTMNGRLNVLATVQVSPEAKALKQALTGQ